MAIAFDSSVTFHEEDTTTPTSTDAWTIAATSDRWGIAAMYVREFASPGTHDGMTIESVSMTQLGTTAQVNGGATTRVSRWNLFGSSEPASGSSRTLAGALSALQNIGLIAAAVYNGVDQTTPVSSTPTATENSWSGVTEVTPHPSITATTVTGGKLIAILTMENDTGAAPASITGTGVTVRAEKNANGNSLYILEKDDTSGSTTIDMTVTFATSTGTWRMDAYAIQPAGGGGGIALDQSEWFTAEAQTNPLTVSVW